MSLEIGKHKLNELGLEEVEKRQEFQKDIEQINTELSQLEMKEPKELNTKDIIRDALTHINLEDIYFYLEPKNREAAFKSIEDRMAANIDKEKLASKTVRKIVEDRIVEIKRKK